MMRFVLSITFVFGLLALGHSLETVNMALMMRLSKYPNLTPFAR